MFKLHRSLVILILAGIVQGCAVSTPPQQQDLAAEALGKTALPGHWGHAQPASQFDAGFLGFTPDPQLKLLIAEAVEYNADLRITAARLEQSRAVLKAAGGPLLPTIAIGGQSGNSAIPTSTMSTTGAGIVANWEVDLWGRMRSEQSAAAARANASALDALYSQQAISAAVVQTWIGITEATQLVAVSRSMYELSVQQQALMEVGRKVGRNSAQDLTQSAAAVEVYKGQLLSNEQRLKQIQRSMEMLLGRYPATALLAAKQLPDVSRDLPAGIPSELLTRRPDVLASEQRFQAAFQDKEAAKRARLPSLKLSGGVAYIEDSVIQLRSGLDNPLWALTGQLMAPIFTGGQLEAQVEAKTAKQKEAVAQYAKVALTALNEVENGLSNELSLLQRQQALKTQSDLTAKMVGYAKVSRKVGKGDQYQLLQQQLNLLSVQANQINLQSARLSNRVALHQALGGIF